MVVDVIGVKWAPLLCEALTYRVDIVDKWDKSNLCYIGIGKDKFDRYQ